MAKSRVPVGTKIRAADASLHAGQTGTVAADWDLYYLIKADDEKYQNAYATKTREGKYFQLDERNCKVVKDKNDKNK